MSTKMGTYRIWRLKQSGECRLLSRRQRIRAVARSDVNPYSGARATGSVRNGGTADQAVLPSREITGTRKNGSILLTLTFVIEKTGTLCEKTHRHTASADNRFILNMGPEDSGSIGKSFHPGTCSTIFKGLPRYERLPGCRVLRPGSNGARYHTAYTFNHSRTVNCPAGGRN